MKKTITVTLIAIGLAVLGINTSSADWHGDDRGYYDRDHNHHSYEYYHHHRGYWQHRNGIQFWINI